MTSENKSNTSKVQKFGYTWDSERNEYVKNTSVTFGFLLSYYRRRYKDGSIKEMPSKEEIEAAREWMPKTWEEAGVKEPTYSIDRDCFRRPPPGFVFYESDITCTIWDGEVSHQVPAEVLADLRNKGIVKDNMTNEESEVLKKILREKYPHENQEKILEMEKKGILKL